MSRETTDPDTPEPFQPDDWISSAETIRRVRNTTLSPTANIDLATRAHAGLLRANAALIIYKDAERLEDRNVPPAFWWARGGQALRQNWELGDFETWIDRKDRIEAYGVRFRRVDVEVMLGVVPAEQQSPPPSKEAGGRPMSPLWPEWVAELALFIHEEGIDGVSAAEELIARLDGRLRARGLDSPARTTVQDSARAVLHRLRAARN